MPNSTKMETALKQISEWELPSTGRYWDDEKIRPMSYESAYGSTGVRHYFQQLATEALK